MTKSITAISMMRRLTFITIMIITFAANAKAGDPKYNINEVTGSFKELAGVHAFTFAEDWSQITINGMSTSEWLEARQFEQPEFDAKKELDTELKPAMKELRGALVEKLQGEIRFTNEEGPDYKLTITPLSIDKKGNMILQCTIGRASGGQVVKFYVKGKGGTFGSMGNLWGDGFESAGKNLAKILKKNIL